jgi:transcription elongation GreA/GreB family factor
MNSFFKQASVSNIQVVLKYWKQQGLLQTESDGKHLSRRIRINGVDQRVYVVKVSKENDQNESSKTRGIRVGDTVSLIVAGTDERMILTLVVDGEVNRFASDIEGRKQVSTKSQLGAALIGKNTGDSVTVKSSSGITLYRILKVYHGTVRRFLYKTDMAKKQHAGAM